MRDSDENAEIAEDVAHAMLEFHSTLHNARTAGAFVAGVGVGAGFSLKAFQLLVVPEYAIYLASAFAILAGGLGGLVLPRAMLWALRGGEQQ